ncbi:MAG: hypothetical protein K9I29_05210 [Bacteroidales bacterium]|nr:hypothetical protein [Bacteroidales bacterium]
MLKKLLFFLSLILLTNSVTGQQQRKERYTGTLRNGLMEPGDVTYYYYKEGNKRVLDGIYRYRLRWRNDERQRVYQTISGSMENDKKAGNWSYSITVQDYFKDDEGYFYSYDIQLGAAYEKGIPDGTWKLNKTKKKRKKSDEEMKGWADYESENTYKIHLEFDHGKLIDTVYFSDEANNIVISGGLDSNGYYHGKWKHQESNTLTIETYHHGIITHRVTKNAKTGKLQNRESLMKNKDMWIKYTSGNVNKSELTFKPETLEVLDNKENTIPKMINEHLFDYRFFLYSHIPGDELIKDYPGKNPASLFSGLKKINFQYQINKNQAKLLSGISRESGKAQRNYLEAREYARDHNIEDKAQAELQKLEWISKRAAKYNCLSGTIKSYMDVNEGRNAAYESCNLRHPVEVKLPTDLSKNKLLKHIYDEVHERYVRSRGLLDKIKSY